MKTVLVLLVAFSLVGCASTDNSQLRAQIAGANIEYAKQKSVALTKPVLDLKMPMSGCTLQPNAPLDSCVMTIIVHAPQDGGNDMQITMPEDPAYRVLGQAITGITTLGGLYVGGTVMTDLAKATAGGIVSALRTQPAPTVVNPVIVPAVDPVIVQPAEPIIVTTPPAQIVNPVIVQVPAP